MQPAERQLFTCAQWQKLRYQESTVCINCIQFNQLSDQQPIYFNNTRLNGVVIRVHYYLNKNLSLSPSHLSFIFLVIGFKSRNLSNANTWRRYLRTNKSKCVIAQKAYHLKVNLNTLLGINIESTKVKFTLWGV